MKVVIPSRLRLDHRWVDACIHNVSSRGLMAGCDDAPAPGSYIEIRRGTIVIVGRVMWTKGRFFGVRSQDRLSVKALVDEPRLASRPQASNDVDTGERRNDRRLAAEARLARRVERSRAFASAFQYAAIAAVVLVVAGIGATGVYRILSAPAAAIERSMAAGVTGGR